MTHSHWQLTQVSWHPLKIIQKALFLENKMRNRDCRWWNTTQFFWFIALIVGFAAILVTDTRIIAKEREKSTAAWRILKIGSSPSENWPAAKFRETKATMSGLGQAIVTSLQSSSLILQFHQPKTHFFACFCSFFLSFGHCHSKTLRHSMPIFPFCLYFEIKHSKSKSLSEAIENKPSLVLNLNWRNCVFLYRCRCIQILEHFVISRSC